MIEIKEVHRSNPVQLLHSHLPLSAFQDPLDAMENKKR